MIVITCLDHRVDPAITLGLRLGDAAVLRNAGGRVTQPITEEIAYLAFLGRRMSNGQLAGDQRFEIAVIHHTTCGASFLVDSGFRHEASRATGVDEATLEASAVGDPFATVSTDVERCSPHPCSRGGWASPAMCTTSKLGASPPWLTHGTPRLGLPKLMFTI